MPRDYYLDDDNDAEDFWTSNDAEVVTIDPVKDWTRIDDLSAAQLRKLNQDFDPSDPAQNEMRKKFGPQLKAALNTIDQREAEEQAEQMREAADEAVGSGRSDAEIARKFMAKHYASEIVKQFKGVPGVTEAKAFKRLVAATSEAALLAEFSTIKAEILEMQTGVTRDDSTSFRPSGLQSEMEAIDLSTPAGQAAWAASRDKFRKALAGRN